MSVQVLLSGDGLKYEFEATVIQAAKIIGFLNTEEALTSEYKSSALNDREDGSSAYDTKLLSSPREAILNAGVKTNSQKILVLGSYLAKRDNSDEFATSELKSLFIKAGEPAPRNLARDVRDAVRTGYIMESMTSSDLYAVTNTGYKALEEGFGAIKLKKHRKSTSRKSSKKIELSAWLNDIQVDDQLEGFLSYRQLNTRSNRVLWILQYIDKVGKNKITGAELSYIADRLSDNIPAQQVAASFSQHIANNRVSKTSEGYRILYRGTEYLKSLNDVEQ